MHEVWFERLNELSAETFERWTTLDNAAPKDIPEKNAEACMFQPEHRLEKNGNYDPKPEK
jgi:hypothetical protein